MYTSVKDNQILSIIIICLLCHVVCDHKHSHYHHQSTGDIGIGALKEVFAWKRFTFKDQGLAGQNGSFFDFPMGLAKHQDRVYLGFPRRSKSTPLGLGYVDLASSANNKSPEVIPYPSAAFSDLSIPSDGKIISVYRPRVDSCNRMWIVDIGLQFVNGVSVKIQEPSLVIIDLTTDQVIKNHTLKNDRDVLFNDPRGLVSITLDIINDDCQNTFAYISDLTHSGLIVYSLSDDDSWRVRHNYFRLDPEEGDFNMNGLRFQFADGVFSVALGPVCSTCEYRIATFHALSSYKERAVSTELLRNKTLATRRFHGDDFWVVGNRGVGANSNAHAIDIPSGVMFSSYPGMNAITCWNIYKNPLNSENVKIIAQSDKLLVFPSDLMIDNEREIWVLTNKFPYFQYSTLDPKEYNFRIYRVPVDAAILGTDCDFKPRYNDLYENHFLFPE